MKEIRDQDIDKLFHERFTKFEPSAPGSVWSGVIPNIAPRSTGSVFKWALKGKIISIVSMLATSSIILTYFLFSDNSRPEISHPLSEVQEESLVNKPANESLNNNKNIVSLPEKKVQVTTAKPEPQPDMPTVSLREKATQSAGKGAQAIAYAADVHDESAEAINKVLNKGQNDISKEATTTIPALPPASSNIRHLTQKKTILTDTSQTDSMSFNCVIENAGIRQYQVTFTEEEADPKDAVLKKKSRPVSFSFFLAPEYANRFLTENEEAIDEEKTEEIADHLNDTEHNKISWHTGIKAEIRLSRKWSLQSGLSYFNYKLASEPVNFTIEGKQEEELQSSNGPIILKTEKLAEHYDVDLDEEEILVLQLSTGQNTGYLSLPLNFRYSMGNFYATAGISTNLKVLDKVNVHVLNTSVEGESENEEEEEEENEREQVEPHDLESWYERQEELSKLSLNLNFGIGYRYYIHKNQFIGIEPEFRLFMMPVNRSAPVKSRPYFMGVAVNVGF